MPRVNRHLSQIRPTIKQQKEVNCMAGDVNVEETVKKIVCERLDTKK